MKPQVAATGGHGAVITAGSRLPAEPTERASSTFKGVLRAPFTRRAGKELAYALATFPLTVAALVFTVPMLLSGPLWALSAPGVRKFGAAVRFLASRLLGMEVSAPPRLRSAMAFTVTTPEPASLAQGARAAGGTARTWQTRPRVTIKKLPPSEIAEIAAQAGIGVSTIRPHNALVRWHDGRVLDPGTWRARGYFAVKLPLAAAGLVGAGGGWLGGLFYLTAPAWWWSLRRHYPYAGFPFLGHLTPFALMPLGAALLLAGPWLLHGITQTDRLLVRGLLGPGAPAERIRALQESRARAVDDSAARFRSIERNLHDGTQAQLVALAMKLGLAREKLGDGTAADMARVTQLVDDAHRGVLEAITDLRTLARGIHPPVLDNGLADALATLANRSTIPVELIADTPERPSQAIETIAYFAAAELLANVAKHSGARHATLEAVHVPGLLRVRVTDDGGGGAHPVPSGGLRGLAERAGTVDGRLDIVSPRGGPTTVTVELPSHA